MDGFGTESNIVVIGATNRIDILDDALLRPGRFDRKIIVRLPEVHGRTEILKVHSKNKKLDESVNLSEISRQTIGFSGADLENLMNECAIRAVNENDGIITPDIIENTYQRIVVGAKNNALVSPETKKRIACHEAGHAIVGALMPNYELVRKISIIPRGEAGGVTFFQPRSDELQMYTQQYLISQIKVALGGHAAEEIVYGKSNVSTGASSDFGQVYAIAREMITTFGFGNIGKINVKQEHLSQTTMFNIESEIKDVVSVCYSETVALLTQHIQQLNLLTNKLIEDEIVNGEFVYDIF